MLTEEHVLAFREQGFCMIPNFFSASEAAAMKRTIEAFKREGLLYDQAAVADHQNFQMHWLSEVSLLWRSLPWDARVQQAVSRLLDCNNIEVHLDQMFLKPPSGAGIGTRYHQGPY
eukprot:SAG31_NODE_6706_length_1917_cov_1.787679_1_plen_115_part_10